MGEYYCWVNVDRKEYIGPSDFGYGNRSYESCQRDGEVLRALRDLLAKEWKGSHIFWMGDECGFCERISNELFDKIRCHSEEVGYPGSLCDTVFDTYINVSSLYKASEEVVRSRIEYFLEDIAIGIDDGINKYGVNLQNPFEGFFEREGADFKYIINYDKKICYSFDETKILFQDGTDAFYADPLPGLLGYGRVMKPGEWLGDIIGVSNEIQDNIIVLDSIMLDQ